MKLKLYDNILLLAMTGTFGYTLWLWIKVSLIPSQSFNLGGALFMTFMGFLMLKFFIVSTAIFIEWGLPRLSKKFKNFKFSNEDEPKGFNLFGKRLEISIRIVDKNRSKVTF